MSIKDNVIDKWEKYYVEELKDTLLFPNEYVIRSFLGKYPNLDINRDYSSKNVCDISCGDGRNMVFLNRLKLNLYGTEITNKICQVTREKLFNHAEKINADIRMGVNTDLPFSDSFFDYVLSWNAIYYMRDRTSLIADHISEYSRIMKKDGYLVCSVPTPNCFSLENAIELENNLIQLNPAYNWGDRNIHTDTIYYRFNSFDHIKDVLGSQFYNFRECKISDDCYGLRLEYFVFVCQKK